MKKWIAIVLVLAAMAGIGMLIMQRAGKVMETREAYKKPVVVPPPAVKIDKVVSHDFVATLEVSGEVRAKRVVLVFPKVGGRVEEMSVELGQAVTAGQVLAKLEENDLGFREKQGEAGTRAASAQVRAAAVQAENARIELNRAEELFKASALPEADLIRARGMKNAADAALSAAKAQVDVAKAGSDLAKEAKSWTGVESPIDGVITKKMIELGGQAGPQQPLFELQDQSSLEIQLDVPPQTLDALLKSQSDKTPIAFTVDERPGKRWNATVKAIGKSLDAMTRRVHVELEVPGEVVADGVLPLMLATVTFELGRSEQVLAAPKDAVVVLSDGPAVFVVRDNKAVRLKPDLGHVDATHVAVPGAKLGDAVVIEGQSTLKDGGPVNVVEAKAEPKKEAKP